MDDNGICHSKLVNPRNQLHSGIITSVSAEETLLIDGTRLHTMKVTFATEKCGPYVLLRREGSLEHADITPYSFLQKQEWQGRSSYIHH